MKLILALLVLLCVFSSVVSFATTSGSKVVKKAPVKPKKVENTAVVIGKKELVDGISEKSGVSKKGVELVLNALTSTIREEVTEKGNIVRMFQFGSFKQRVFKARNVRNPKTGAVVAAKESKSLGFSASSAMKEKEE